MRGHPSTVENMEMHCNVRWNDVPALKLVGKGVTIVEWAAVHGVLLYTLCKIVDGTH